MTTQNVTFIVEDAAGMGPGGVDEGDGSSEIEIFVNLAGGTSHLLSVRFGDFPSRFAVGQDGFNLNADESTDDLDITVLGTPEIDVRGGFATPVNVGAQGGDGTGAARTDPIEFLGSSAGDTVVGGDGADEINALGGNDTVQGHVGDDLVRLGLGDEDTFDGGSGFDTVDYAGGMIATGVTVDLALTGPQPTGVGGVDTLAGVENAAGTMLDDVLRGTDGPNILDGGGGGDILEGRGGLDLLNGRTGNDRIEARDGGADTVDCNDGADVAVADAAPLDTLLGCETVLFPPVPVVPAAPAATAAAGAAAGASSAGAVGQGPTARAALTALRLTPSAFAPFDSGPSARTAGRPRRPRGTIVSFTMSRAALVTYRVARRRSGRRVGRRCVAPSRRNSSRRRCVRFVPVRGSFTRAARAGTNRFRFTGRLRGRALARGRYQLRATPRGGATTRTAFRIVR
jgi:hypothetical protein